MLKTRTVRRQGRLLGVFGKHYRQDGALFSYNKKTEDVKTPRGVGGGNACVFLGPQRLRPEFRGPAPPSPLAAARHGLEHAGAPTNPNVSSAGRTSRVRRRYYKAVHAHAESAYVSPTSLHPTSEKTSPASSGRDHPAFGNRPCTACSTCGREPVAELGSRRRGSPTRSLRPMKAVSSRRGSACLDVFAPARPRCAGAWSLYAAIAQHGFARTNPPFSGTATVDRRRPTRYSGNRLQFGSPGSGLGSPPQPAHWRESCPGSTSSSATLSRWRTWEQGGDLLG